MTAYMTCQGCKWRKSQCERKDAMRASLRGLSVTSIRWKCQWKVPEFQPGEAVWALTWSGEAQTYDGEDAQDNFAARVIRIKDSKAIVYIAPNEKSRECEYEFKPKGNGFCKVPLSRITPRDAPIETICEHCGLPASFGHQSGYCCSTEEDNAQ